MRTATVLFFALAMAGWANAGPLAGKVVAIADGDTLTLLTADRQQVKVRLAEIDTPERAQPYGTRARQALSDLAFGKQATIESHEKDRYGRTVGRVYVNGVDVNRELVSLGAAWVYRQYNRDKSLLAVEAEARAAKRGLWSLPEAERLAPWDWRKGTKAPAIKPYGGAPLVAAANDGQYSCSPRKTCGQMSSCAEARFQLEQCGNSRLDRDKDGIPCESLCQ
ncbi:MULTISPECIES: thermonuclease family protein [Stutzerimonas]|uniref:thermonuclease family protein n=1 Tax=Stutzerimonas TaxID=2901164 RepID=UPI00244B2248|nr:MULTISPECIES: thermonuclease family protein [Stutzerimonas]MDH1587993.1 thermonuclease family protein [Stutzerimonas stutzeri]MDL2174699.1 thermonuclease family protein [Stutzerimonas sp. FeSN7]